MGSIRFGIRGQDKGRNYDRNREPGRNPWPAHIRDGDRLRVFREALLRQSLPADQRLDIERELEGLAHPVQPD